MNLSFSGLDSDAIYADIYFPSEVGGKLIS